MELPEKFTITENRVEQWETEYSVKELGIRGIEKQGLIQALAEEVWKLRSMIASKHIEVYEGILKYDCDNDSLYIDCDPLFYMNAFEGKKIRLTIEAQED